jgi:hypothetical protein
MKKESILETINNLPSEFDLDELLEKLIFMEKVETGLKQLEESKTLNHEEVKESISKW